MKKYWMCIIEVDTRRDFPMGFDSPPRLGAVDAIRAAGFGVSNCWSGWGTTQKKIDKIQKLWNSEEDR